MLPMRAVPGRAKKSAVESFLDATIAHAFTTFSSETSAVFENPDEPELPSYVSWLSAQRTAFDAATPDLYFALVAVLALPFVTL